MCVHKGGQGFAFGASFPEDVQVNVVAVDTFDRLHGPVDLGFILIPGHNIVQHVVLKSREYDR